MVGVVEGVAVGDPALVVALFVVIVALLLANRRTVEVSWVVGSSRQSVVWIVLVTAILAVGQITWQIAAGATVIPPSTAGALCS